MILNIGHRGFGVHAIENTLSAVQKAIDFKLDMIEFDVRLTRDHEVVVFHDRSLKRLASVNLNIDETEYKTLKNINIFSKKKSGDTDYEKIPSLKEIIELSGGKIQLNIEIKKNNHLDKVLVDKVVSIIRDYNIYSQVVISSFSKEILKWVCHIDDNIRCGYVYHKKANMKNIFIPDCKLYSIHPYKYLIGKKLIQTAHDKSIKVFPWTANSYKLMNKLIQMGVDGIITNHPLLLRNLLIVKDLNSKK